MDSPLQVCVVCKKGNDEEPGVKKYQSLVALRRAAERRRSLTTDKFAIATQDIIATESEDLFYHTTCNSRYCAVKRKTPDDPEPHSAPPPTRSRSDLPKLDACVFCAIVRKRQSNSGSASFESLHKVETMECSTAMINAAKHSKGLKNSQHILALGSEDLVAIGVQYHNSCRLKFLQESNELEKPSTPKYVSNRKKHDKVFEVFNTYIEHEIIRKRVPKFASKLLDLYKEQYKEMWGADEDVDDYSSQAFIRKIQSSFCKRLVIAKDSNKEGNFLYPSDMSFSDAKSHLKNSNVNEEDIRCAALLLRSEILNMEKTKMPAPTTVHSLKERAPEIPSLTKVFYQTLMSGLTQTPGEATQRKTLSLASDAVFSTSRGTVKPWKNTCLGLGFSSMLGSKTAVTILNRLGHAVCYDECKRLETEIAYTCSSGELETPAGLMSEPTLATGTAWDNYDLNMETLDGKNSLHVTVGIAYQNAIQPQASGSPVTEQEPVPTSSVSGRPRRKFDGVNKPIEPFHRNLKLAKFKFEETNQDRLSNCDVGYSLVRATSIGFVWLVMSRHTQLPLFNGFYSQFRHDPLPLTVIAYMDPISQPPTRNDVVRETMFRSLKVAEETKMPYHPVTYDLAVALKAYSIQTLEAPVFDRLIILLGHFHIELAFFGALGTYIADSGLEYLLTEADVLAQGSLNGFTHGKLFNRCTRIHQVTAMAFEKALFERFLGTATIEDHDVVIDNIRNLQKEDTVAQLEIAESEVFQKLLDDYEQFLHRTIKGEFGKTAAFWAVYVYFVNRLYREFQRAVRTNDVDLYIEVLPSLIEVFFCLNRPNYARWGSYFLERLQHMAPEPLNILKAGAFSTRRTKKTYSRCPIDITLEQTVNRDAASSATGITHFASSDSAFRRWCVNLTQRSMAVSELKDMSGIQHGETPANQLRKRRIERDNSDAQKILQMMDDTCNPFAIEAPDMLVNIATGKAATQATSTYLLGTMQRGAKLRQEFHKECVADDSRFLKTVKRVKVQNFAAANAKKRASREKRALGAAEGVRDAFGYLLSKIGINLYEVMCFPITEVPLALAHTDGTPVKTDKAALTKLLETRKPASHHDGTTRSRSMIDATLFDGGLVLHEVLPGHNTSTYGKIVTDIMIKVCSASGESAHLLLDKYIKPSIKDVERFKRGDGLDETGDETNTFIITGSEQKQQKKGVYLVDNGAFKEALNKFLLTEIQREHYVHIIRNKTVYVSHGGKCVRLSVNDVGMMVVEEPTEFQGNHEEADTLLAFHVYRIGGRIMVRSSDTDVVVILVGLVAKMSEQTTIMMDFGSGNYRRLINVTAISRDLEMKQPGLSEALIGFHALTGNDFNSAFYKKGKSIPFSYLEKDDSHVLAMRSLCSDVIDKPAITAYICRMYGFKGLNNINEARYQKFVKMTRGKGQNVKKINCSSLPPCERTLSHHISRANYIAIMWRLAHTPDPTNNLHPLNFGWIESADGRYVHQWFEGAAVPDTLLETNEDSGSRQVIDDESNRVLADTEMDHHGVDTNIYNEVERDRATLQDYEEEIQVDDQPWSDDSESDCEDDE